LKSVDKSTEQLAKALRIHLENFSGSLDSASVAMVCLGMQGLDCNNSTMFQLIESLVHLITKSKAILNNRLIGNVFYGIKYLPLTVRGPILQSCNMEDNLAFMSKVESLRDSEDVLKLLYSQYLAYILATDPERGLQELQLLTARNKIQHLKHGDCIDCHNHVPTTAVALVSFYLTKDITMKNRKTWTIIVGQSKGDHWRAEHRRVRPAVEAWLKENGYSFSVSTENQGRLIVQI
jgi:hypothetical protein